MDYNDKEPLKEITINSSKINKLPSKNTKKEITTQIPFSFVIERQAELKGIEMGVLSDGTPFLSQRGLARLCGVKNAHIGTISSQWNDEDVKPRIYKVKQLLAQRGLYIDAAHVVASYPGKNKQYAYPDSICLAVLEYYAFEAGSNYKENAEKNFRLLAGKGLRDFIYGEVGYDPEQAHEERWQNFHDRVSLTYNSVPDGYFGIFKEISDMIVTLGEKGLHINSSFVPDISVGLGWAKHWRDNDLSDKFGLRIEYEHNYPKNFPQAKSNPQRPWCYPEMSLGEFRRWFRENYIKEGKFKKYLMGQVKKKSIPITFAELAISAYDDE